MTYLYINTTSLQLPSITNPRKLWILGTCFLYLLSYVQSGYDGTHYNKTVDYYVKVVNEGQEIALNYELPTDASMYKGDLSQILGKYE